MKKIYIGKYPIEEFVLSADKDGWRAKNTASYILIRTIQRLTGITLRRISGKADRMIRLEEITEGVPTEYMRIYAQDGNIFIEGGRRGIIYAAYEFTEKYLGVHYYARGCETIPQEDEIRVPADIDWTGKAFSMQYRDFFGKAVFDEETKMRLRYNVQSFGVTWLDTALGGAITYAGDTCHTLSGRVLLKSPRYHEQFPEYFSLVNGKRLTDGSGQICLTNPGALEAVIYEVKKLLQSHPQANYISVSEDDNWNYCQCENCKKALEKQSFSDLFFTFVNKVARAIKDEFPHVLVHTFAYHGTVNPPSFAMEDNVAVQVTMQHVCQCHAVDDVNCPYNARLAAYLQEWSSKCKHIITWEYYDNHQVNLFNQPNILYYRRMFRFYADHNIKGVYFEDDHDERADIPCSAAFSELKAYLVSRLCQDSYMSEETFNKHIDDFLYAFYGAGAGYIREYLELWAREATEHVKVSGCSFESNARDEIPGTAGTAEKMAIMDENLRRNLHPIIPIERTKIVCDRALELFDRAMEAAQTDLQRQRVHAVRTHVLFYEQYWTMGQILANGTREEKEETLKKNRELIDGILEHKFKLTLYRGTVIEQMSEAIMRYEVPPDEWGYAWIRDPSK